MTKRILLCDDEIHILRAAEFKLKKAGYEVQIANDGLEAWQFIAQQTPDMLITDYQMPRLDGFGLVKKVRGNPATADMPVFMLTAKGFEISHEELAEKWNVMAVIAKPFSPRELLQRVDAVLKRGDADRIPCETASGAGCETASGRETVCDVCRETLSDVVLEPRAANDEPAHRNI